MELLSLAVFFVPLLVFGSIVVGLLGYIIADRWNDRRQARVLQSILPTNAEHPY